MERDAQGARHSVRVVYIERELAEVMTGLRSAPLCVDADGGKAVQKPLYLQLSWYQCEAQNGLDSWPTQRFSS